MTDEAANLVHAGMQPRHSWAVRSLRQALWPVVRAWFLYEDDRISSVQGQAHALASQFTRVRAQADAAEERAGRASDAVSQLQRQSTSAIEAIEAIKAAKQADDRSTSAIEAALDDIASRMLRIEDRMRDGLTSLEDIRHALSQRLDGGGGSPAERMAQVVAYDLASVRAVLSSHAGRFDRIDADLKGCSYERTRAEAAIRADVAAVSDELSRLRTALEAVAANAPALPST